MSELDSAHSLRILNLLWSRESNAVKDLESMDIADLSQPSISDGRYPLEIAVEIGPLEKIVTLLEKGVSPDVSSTTITPLMQLLKNQPLLWDDTGTKRHQAINFLLNFGASHDKSNALDATPTDYAWESGLGTMFTRILMAQGIEPRLPSAAVRFISSVALGQVIQADTLLRLDVSVNTRMRSDLEGKTALMLAAQRGDFEMLHLLLSHKADVTLRTQQNIRSRRIKGSSADFSLQNEKTALFFAVDRGKIPVIRSLLGNLKSKKTSPAEYCPLKRAQELGREDIIDIFKFANYQGKALNLSVKEKNVTVLTPSNR
jgi:ankyrin repeat protein